MKLIAATALAVLFACPAFADFDRQMWPVHCTTNYDDIEKVHGKLTFRIEPQKRENDFGFAILENNEEFVVIFLKPNGEMCVSFAVRKDGSPA